MKEFLKKAAVKIKNKISKKHKILFLTNAYAHQAGSGNYSSFLVSELNRLGHKIDVLQVNFFDENQLFFFPDGKYDNFISMLLNKNDELNKNNCLNKNYDIVHINGPATLISVKRNGVYDKLLSFYPNAKKINIMHSWEDHPTYENPDDKILLDMFKEMDISVHVTKNMFTQCHGTKEEINGLFSNSQDYGRMGFAEKYNDKAVWIYNGIPYDKIIKKEISLKKKSDQQDIIFTFLGRLCYQKNIINFCSAFVEFYKQGNHNIKLWLIGDGPDRDKIEQTLMALPSDKYELFGWKFDREKDELLEKTDVLVIPSNYESFCLAAVEGFSKNIPLLISNVGGPKEIFIGNSIIKNSEQIYVGHSALGFDPNNKLGMINAMKFILNPANFEIVENHVKNGQYLLEKYFNSRHMAKKYVELYSSLLKNKEFSSDKIDFKK